MSIYHKIIELSITIVSLAGLTLNFLFPHIALANDIGKNNALSFSFLENAEVLPFVLGKTDVSLAVFANIVDEQERMGAIKAFALPIEPTYDEIAENICIEAGITDLPCWQDLKSMRQKESYDGKAMVGDGGKSRGWYHIQTKMHKISVECALDFKCSTEWTLKNLIANGYKTNRAYAISRHNGSGVMARIYAKSVIYNSAKLDR